MIQKNVLPVTRAPVSNDGRLRALAVQKESRAPQKREAFSSCAK
jgi:hypothetical protein